MKKIAAASLAALTGAVWAADGQLDSAQFAVAYDLHGGALTAPTLSGGSVAFDAPLSVTFYNSSGWTDGGPYDVGFAFAPRQGSGIVGYTITYDADFRSGAYVVTGAEERIPAPVGTQIGGSGSTSRAGFAVPDGFGTGTYVAHSTVSEQVFGDSFDVTGFTSIQAKLAPCYEPDISLFNCGTEAMLWTVLSEHVTVSPRFAQALDAQVLTAPVPEPAEWALMLGGLAALCGRSRRSK